MSTRVSRTVVVCWIGLMATIGCVRHEHKPDVKPDGAVSAPASPSAEAVTSRPPVTPADAGAVAVSEPRGSVRFVIQRVNATCVIGTSPMSVSRNLIGFDLLVETREPDEKPRHRFAFCAGDDIKSVNWARLNTWRMCHAYTHCEPAPADGSTGDTQVVCGKDHVSLEVRGDRTLLLGPFGEKEISSHPMTIAKPKYETRDAWVDC